MKTKLRLVVIMLSICGIMQILSSFAGEAKILLIDQETSIRHDVASLTFLDPKDAVIRFREVQINQSLRTMGQVQRNDIIQLNLFPDMDHAATISDIDENVNQTVTITARFADFDFAYAIIATTDNRTLVTIEIPELDKHFQILSNADDLTHYLLEIDRSFLDDFDRHPPAIPPPPTEKDFKEQQRIRDILENTRSGPWDPATIDIMMVYTPAAETWANASGGGIFNRIATAIATAQLCLTNSNTIVTMRLVHNALTDYTESTSVRADLRRLTTSATLHPWGSSWTDPGNNVTYNMLGFMDEVHDLRDSYGADLVLLLSTMGGGIGWVLNTSAGSPDYGFSIAGITTTSAYTPIHEMGHNMGCGHHKEQVNCGTNPGQPGPALFSFSAGWRWTGNDDVRYCDLMTYENGCFFPDGNTHSRVPHFSNPTVNFQGVATGDFSDGDNAWTIQQVKHVIAAYRSTSTTAGMWIGSTSSDWHDPLNWLNEQVPTSSVDVTIPANTPHSPVIYGGNAYCRDLVVQYGATLTQNSTSYFHVYGTFDPAFGQFIMNGTTSYLYFRGSTNTYWYNDMGNDIYTNVRVNKATGNSMTMLHDTPCFGNFRIMNGILVLSGNRTLTVLSTASTAFRIEDNGVLNLSANRTISVAGRIIFYDGSQANVTGGTIRCGGNFRVEDNTSTNIQLTNATLVLNGSGNQLIQDLDGNSIHHLTIDKPSGIASIDEANMSIAGNLIINSGTFNVNQWTCDIGGNTNISGTLAMPHASGVINANGDVVWNSGSTANFTAMNVFNVWGHWNFENGSNANLGNGVVAFRGTSSRYVRSYSLTSSFNNISSYKTGGAELGISNLSTQPLTINGNIYVHPGANFGIYSFYNVVLKGNVNSNGVFICNFGTVVLNGANQSLRMNTGNYFSNLTFNQSGTVTIDNTLSNILEVRGSVLIQSGEYSIQDRIMYVAGNWTNNNYPAGFVPGAGRVVFNGSSNQNIHSNENFNILEADLGGNIRVNNAAHTVTCNQYDWTAGGIEVQAGTFTASDLAQNGLYGSYSVNAGGTINLTNSTGGSWVDLRGSIYNYGGTMNISGSIAWWPYADDAHLTMTDGVIDIKTCGLRIHSGPTWSYNITGGTIRTAHHYTGNRTDFNPTAGTFEFYGSANASINQTAGNTLHNVVINKSASRDGKDEAEIALYDKRSGELLSDGGRSAAISLGSNFMITNNLTVESGTLNIGAHELTVAREAYIDGTLSMTNASGILNAGTASMDWLEFRNGSVANITHGTINCYGWILPRGGSSFNLGLDNTLFIKGEPSGGLSNFEPAATYGNVVIAKNAGAYSVIDGVATEPVVINGDFTISDNNTFRTQYNRMTVYGEFTDSPSSIIQVTHSAVKTDKIIESSCEESLEMKPGRTSYYLEIDSEFDIKGQLIINSTGTVYVHGRFSSSPGSSIHINNGSFISDAPNHPDKGWQYLNGNLTLINGLFEITNNSVNFGATATTSVSGGVIRSGGAFAAVDPGVFQPTGGIVEIIGSNPDVAIYCYNTNHFHNLTINRIGGYSAFMWGEPVLIQNNFTVNSGEIRSGASEISVLGDVAVNSGGHLSLSSIGSLLMSASRSINVNNGGLLELTGDISNQPKISRISSGHYAFNVESGGTIAAEYALFEYMDNNGINIKPGAIVDHTKAFHNCTFRLGQSGGRLMTINNSQTFAVNYAKFPNNTWGGTYNVFKTENAGVVTFMGYSGLFSGETNEWDPHQRIHWGGETAPSITLQGVEIVPGQNICFEATNTLTVGGSGSYFEIHNGGFVELVAGEKIRMLEGTHFHHGSYGLARITTTGDYCSLPAALISTTNETLTSIDEASENESGDLFFRVYPNPTIGIFNLEIPDVASTVVVEIYSMMGGQLLKQEVSGFMRYEFDLSTQSRGLYIIRVHDGVKMGTQRIIRQ